MSVKPVAWTPGPWKSEKDRDGRYLILPTRKDYGPIGKVYYLQDVPLIESAPELAEALQNLVRAYEAVVRGEVGNVGEKANPEFYAAVSLLARITPK